MKTQLTDNAPAAKKLAAADHASTHGSPVAQAESAETSTPLAHAAHSTWDLHVNHNPRQAAQRRLLGTAFGPAAQLTADDPRQGVGMQTLSPVPFAALYPRSLPPLQRKIGLSKHGALVCSVANNARIGTAVWRGEQMTYDIKAGTTFVAKDVSPDDEQYTVADLEHLKMNSGTVNDYANDLAPELAELSKIAEKIYKTRALENRILACGYFDITLDETDDTGLKDVMEDDSARLATFMTKFMMHNGQLPYIMNSEGFIAGDWTVQVDINYYTDRKPESGWGPHKDTEGSNLFVNLLFNNAQEIPGTEFTNDTKKFGARQGPGKFLPNELQESIAKAKKRIKGDDKDTANKEWKGGVLGAGGYVSFVDELVWHSTPIAEKRARHSTKDVGAYILSSYKTLRKSKFLKYYESNKENLRKQNPKLFNENENLLIDIYDKMMVFSESGTPGLDNVALPSSMRAWLQLPRDEKGTLARAIEKLMRGVDDEMVAEGGIGDVVEDSVPTKVATRPRSKSSSDLSVWKGLEDANKDIPRSFFRTWVRIKKKGTLLPKSL